jgi:hypothetical protein
MYYARNEARIPQGVPGALQRRRSSPPATFRRRLRAGRRNAVARGAAAAYSPAIDKRNATRKNTMNTTRTASLSAFFSAAVVTLAMLAGVNSLATSEPTAAQIAHGAASAPRA